ncbi:MAG: ABC transporter ATP-binding protein, partial [Bryobacteraceae bacterium]
MSEKPVKPRAVFAILKTVRPYVWRYRRGFGMGMGALVLKDLLGAAQPLLIGAGIDALTRGFRMETVLTFAALLAACSAAKGLFQYWMRVILISISRDIEYDLRNDIFAHLVTLDSHFFSRYRTGDIMARATNDLNAVRMMLGPGIMYWSETVLTLILAVGVMLSVDWPLTLIALAPAPFVSLAVIVFGRRIHERFEQIQEKFSDISSRVQENLSGVRVLRAYAQEAAELARFESLNQDYVEQNIKLARLSGLFMPLLTALISVGFLLVLLAGGVRLLAHHITLGDFVMFNTYMGMLVWPMIAMGWVVNLLQRGSASLFRINQMMHEEPVIAAPPTPVAPAEPVRGEIELRNVTVRYPSCEALRGVSMRIPAGSTVAIVGHTGSGKTTLVSLIARLIDPSAGTIRLDGVDVRDLD